MQNEKFDKMIAEAYSCIGMIAEVRSKCKLLKSNLDSGRITPKECKKSVNQMKADLCKYNSKLELIGEELIKNGHISQLD